MDWMESSQCNLSAPWQHVRLANWLLPWSSCRASLWRAPVAKRRAYKICRSYGLSLTRIECSARLRPGDQYLLLQHHVHPCLRANWRKLDPLDSMPCQPSHHKFNTWSRQLLFAFNNLLIFVPMRWYHLVKDPIHQLHIIENLSCNMNLTALLWSQLVIKLYQLLSSRGGMSAAL